MSGFVGWLIGFPTLKAKLRSDYFAIARWVLGRLSVFCWKIWTLRQGARGLPGIAADTTLPVVLVISVIVLWIARITLLRRASGRAAIAVREDFTAAEMMGNRPVCCPHAFPCF